MLRTVTREFAVSPQLLSELFLILGRNERDVIDHKRMLSYV